MTAARPGQSQRQVTVESVDLVQGQASCKEKTTGNRQVVPVIPLRTGMLPQVGQTWLLDKSVGAGWTFAALVGGPRLQVTGFEPSAMVLSSAATGQTLPATTLTKVPLDTVKQTAGAGLTADLANDRILVNRAGLYLVSASCGIAAPGTSTGLREILVFWHNTADLAEAGEAIIGATQVPPVNGTTIVQAVARLVPAVAGDYFYAEVSQTSGAGQTFTNTNGSMWLQAVEWGQHGITSSVLAALAALGLVGDQTV